MYIWCISEMNLIFVLYKFVNSFVILGLLAISIDSYW